MKRIRKGDEVIVTAGKDRGKRGKVLRLEGDQRVLVENVNRVKRHMRGNPLQGKPGGILDREAFIDVSNVALFNPVTQKADKVGFRFLADGKKVRFFKSNGEIIDN